jgi:hypothetical protein
MQTLKPSLQVGIHLISGSRRAAANARRPGLLAKETARATEDIAQKIDAIQWESEAAVKAIAEASKIITQVNDISDTIASAVDKQTATTAEIGLNRSIRWRRWSLNYTRQCIRRLILKPTIPAQPQD